MLQNIKLSHKQKFVLGPRKNEIPCKVWHLQDPRTRETFQQNKKPLLKFSSNFTRENLFFYREKRYYSLVAEHKSSVLYWITSVDRQTSCKVGYLWSPRMWERHKRNKKPLQKASSEFSVNTDVRKRSIKYYIWITARLFE